MLEIGFGPGTTVPRLANLAVHGRVAGVDLSEVMVKQAIRRNRSFVQSGRVELKQGSVSSLPYEEGRFNKVLAVNSFDHWPSPADDLREVRRVMKNGGLLLLAFREALPTKSPMAAPGLSQVQIEQVERLVRNAGFRDIHTIKRQAGRPIALVLANR